MDSPTDHCAALVRAADRDRYLAALFAPAQHRGALLALYAFNVEIARVRDLAREPMPGEIRLQWWREVLSGARDGEAAAHPVAAALQGALTQYRIAPDGLLGLIDAHAFDLYDEPMGTLDDLDRYGARTQGALLAAAAGILGGGETAGEALLRHAGIGYAIAGILSGFGRHAARRQLYLPLEVLERHRVEREDIFARTAGEGLRGALGELMRHGRRQLAAAQGELASAPSAMFPALLPMATAGPQLRRAERPGRDPFGPLPLSALRRQWLIWRAARDPRRIFAG